MAWVTPKTDWSSSNGVSATDMNRIEGNILALKHTTLNVTATAAGWAGASAPFTQSIAVTGATASNIVVASLAAGITLAQMSSASDAQMVCTAQGTNTITMSAFDIKPLIDLPLTVLIIG